ncbi:MAG: Crp/Fnr family transcriptional regulator, partial [Pyrinomonadaceae bacterium]|nr:Crp/Fnr family transcriptional regulator [Pyrinomonadaceae bacterium]
VKLTEGRMLYNAGDELREAYFIQSGVVSYISAAAVDEESAAGVVGDEGVVGLPSFLRYHRAMFRVIVQIEGEALRVDGEFLRREYDKGGELQNLILCYAHTVVSQFSQAIVCNRFHIVEKRLARFLLMVHDRARSDTLHLTHEFLASMLGTSRTDVTEAAGALQDAGLIRYRRGAMTILDKAGLKAATCVCYQILLEEYEHFLFA